MAFDPDGNLYVSPLVHRLDVRSPATPSRSSTDGPVARRRRAAATTAVPHTLVFDSVGTAYVGQAGCRQSILKFVPGAVEPIELLADVENAGIFWLDLAADGCTLFYTSWGPNVKRFDVLRRRAVAQLQRRPAPGRRHPGSCVSFRTEACSSRTETSSRGSMPRARWCRPTRDRRKNTLWAGLDLVGDGTFWVANYYSSNVYRFDLATGAIVDSFNTGTPPNSAVGVRVKR